MSDMATMLGSELHMPIRRISVDDYHRMAEAGVFRDNERVELLDGLLISMAPISWRHGYATRTLNSLFGLRYGDRAVIDSQGALSLRVDSEPQPDVMVLRGPFTRYEERKPIASDVLLLVEVSETSRTYDAGPKLRSYAEAGVAEVWIVDLVEECVLVFREPGDEGYAVRVVHRRGERVAAVAFPADEIAVSDFLRTVAEPGG